MLTVLGEAERFGAICANGMEVIELVEENGRAAGVVVRETESGEQFTIEAANVVNATGVWADRVAPDEIHDAAEVPTIRPSRGTHITLTHERLPLEAGAIVPAGGGRTIFALPWLGNTLLGTTDNDFDGDIDHVRPADDDIDYLLEAANDFFGTELAPGDVAGAYAGVRPLISRGDAKKSVDISRKAELYETSSGMITITGGKLTTWRRMAKLTVDRLVEREDREAPCRTHEIPLGHGHRRRASCPRRGRARGPTAALAGRYGHAAHDVLALAAERGELAQPIVPGHPDLLAEAVFAARREQARSAADVLLRRTRLGLLAARELTAPEPRSGRARGGRAGRRTRLGRAAHDRRGARFRDEAADEGLVARPPRPAPAGRATLRLPTRRVATAVEGPACPAPSVYATVRCPLPTDSDHAPMHPLLARHRHHQRLARRRGPCPARAYFAGDVIDSGPGITALGNADVATDGTGGVAYVRNDGVVDRTVVARLASGRCGRARRSTPASSRRRPSRSGGRRRRPA